MSIGGGDDQLFRFEMVVPRVIDVRLRRKQVTLSRDRVESRETNMDRRDDVHVILLDK